MLNTIFDIWSGCRTKCLTRVKSFSSKEIVSPSTTRNYLHFTTDHIEEWKLHRVS